MPRPHNDPWREAWEESWRYIRSKAAISFALPFVVTRGPLDVKAKRVLAVRDHGTLSLRQRLRLRRRLRDVRGEIPPSDGDWNGV